MLTVLTHIMSTSDKLFAGVIYLTNHIGFIEIPMVAFVVRRHIHIHNVTILQGALVGYPMTDDLNMRAWLIASCVSLMKRRQDKPETSHDDALSTHQGDLLCAVPCALTVHVYGLRQAHE